MTRMSSSLWFALLAAASLLGCSSVSIDTYRDRSPAMIPETFFNGALVAHGVVKDRSGEVLRYFNADIKAFWDGPTGTLEEDFVFDDGEKQRRVWTLIRQGDGRYIGTASDIVGEAHGQVAGNSMFFRYVLRIPYADDTLDLEVDDRMYLVNENTIVNESQMSKFGLRVGQTILVIRKE